MIGVIVALGRKATAEDIVKRDRKTASRYVPKTNSLREYIVVEWQGVSTVVSAYKQVRLLSAHEKHQG